VADVRDGLSIGGDEGLDPNDPRDFEKIMEGLGVPKEDGEGESPSTDIRSGLTTAEPGQAREPATGKFVAAESKTPPADAPDTSQVSDDEQQDPEVAAFLAKNNNDPAAALKAAAGLTSVVGRQGQELGSTREELAELRGRLNQMAAAPAAPQVLVPQEQVDTQAGELISTEGYFNAATRAANLAVQTGDERLYQSIRETWALDQPGAAMDFNTDFRMWQRDQANAAAAAANPAQPEDWMVQARQQAQVTGIETSLSTALSGYSEEDTKLISSHFEAAMQSMPPNVLAMVGSSDPEARDAGVQLVVDRATLLATKTPAPAEGDKTVVVPDPVVAKSVQRKLAGAAVATGALRPAAAKTAQTTESREDAIKEFKRQIVEAETTNVSSGLTYGPQR
jgi:hypothetical protein